jgi:hypothetical protein
MKSRRVDLPLRMRRRQPDSGTDVRDAVDPLGMISREDGRPQGSARDGGQRGVLGVCGVHHGQRVGDELVDGVGRGTLGPVGATVASPVERDDAAVPRQVRDLELPATGVDDRPRGQEQRGRLTLAVRLVEHPHAVALHVSLLVGVPRARLLPPGAVRGLAPARRRRRVRGSRRHGRVSNTRLKGVSAARRKCVKPPASTTSRMRASPACAPRARPTSCESEAGVQSRVENA